MTKNQIKKINKLLIFISSVKANDLEILHNFLKTKGMSKTLRKEIQNLIYEHQYRAFFCYPKVSIERLSNIKCIN